MMNRNVMSTVPDRALMEFFRPPALGYSRNLRANLDRDPAYVERNKSEVYRELRGFLTRAGFAFDEQGIDRQMEYVVREVVGRLRSYEKGESEVHYPRTISETVMERQRNTTVSGEPFGQSMIAAVWAKGQPELWFTFFKRDVFGSTIERGEYGKEGEYGWEIDRIVPLSRGGTDDLANLRPLHWKNVGR